MVVKVDTVEDLANLLQNNRVRRVGIDGIAGCGKTTPAIELSKSFELDLLCIDDFLYRNKGSYFDHLRLEDLNRDYHRKSQCIIEGVGLLKVLVSVGLDIDTLVYIKRMQHGIWADEQ